jgi:catechol 2,3-dioxygenase-like lactoylglutathione lyase family enzyme
MRESPAGEDRVAHPLFAVAYVAISVGDLAAQRAFYGKALGLVEQSHTDIPDAQIRISLLAAPTGLALELIERRGPKPFTG